MARLVEILALEINEWPDKWVYVTQDADGDTSAFSGKGFSLYGGFWSGGESYVCGSLRKFDLATDHATAIVTREMWEDERNSKPSLYMQEVGRITRNQSPGECLPPVGAVCETALESSGSNWWECRIVAHVTSHGRTFAIAQMDNRFNYSSHGYHFRPIDQRTDREKWIEAVESLRCCGEDRIHETMLSRIYDNGLAKLPE